MDKRAIGMGLADIITRRVFNKIDFKATYENVVTSSFLERGFVPIIVDNERTGLDYALRSCGLADLNNPRIIRIKNTPACLFGKGGMPGNYKKSTFVVLALASSSTSFLVFTVVSSSA